MIQVLAQRAANIKKKLSKYKAKQKGFHKLTRTESAQNLWLIQMPIHLYTRKRKKARTALNYKFIFFIIKYISKIRAVLDKQN